MTDVDNHSFGVLHMAVERNGAAILSILLQNGADPDMSDQDLNTPLHLAVKLGHLESVRALMEESSANLGVNNIV